MDETNFLNSLTWVAVDTETSGTNPWKYELIEIGAIKFSIEGVIEKFNVLIKAKKKHDPKSRLIHNISDSELNMKGVSLKEALSMFYKFIGDSPLIFHNASFDLSFLYHSSRIHNILLPENYYYDTLFLFKKHFPDFQSYSLTFLKEKFKLNCGVSHRATSDAEATGLLFIELLKQNISKISSNRKLKTFLRYHRKLSEFEFKFPENYDEIDQYVRKLVKLKSSIKINYIYENKKISEYIIPLDIMVFNQMLFVKGRVPGLNVTKLIPIKDSVFFDRDLGSVKLQ